MKDAFDVWWYWAEKPLDSMLTIPAELHDAVMVLSLPQSPGLRPPREQCRPEGRFSRRASTLAPCASAGCAAPWQTGPNQ